MKAAALVAALGLAVHASAGVEVGMRDGRIRLEAKSAPLSEILDGLARETGMKVIYDGAPPREPITISLDRATAIEVLLEVLERLGPDYALRLDATGTRAATLVVVASSASKRPQRGASHAPLDAEAASAPRPPADSADAEIPEETEGEQEIDPTAVFRDRVVTDPVTGGPPYGVEPEQVETSLPPESERVQGDPTEAAAPHAPSPQPTPTPAPAPTDPDQR